MQTNFFGIRMTFKVIVIMSKFYLSFGDADLKS